MGVAPAAPVVHQPPPIKKNKELDLKSNLFPSKDDIKKSKSKEEKKEERKKEQKSIKEFFFKKHKKHRLPVWMKLTMDPRVQSPGRKRTNRLQLKTTLAQTKSI